MEIHIQRYQGDGSDWDAYVADHPDSVLYHLYGWRSVMEKSFGHATYYLTVKNSQGEIKGVVPLTFMESALFGKFIISLPFFNYGGILPDDQRTAHALLQETSLLLRELQAEYVEFRNLERFPGNLETKEHKVTMILDLAAGEELQWKALDPKVRNQVRKAEKSGLKAVIGRLELLDGFYEVFSRNMRDLGTPVYGLNFFRNVLETFPENSAIISVKLGDKTVASGLLLWFRETLEVPWASSIGDYREKCPNNLLYWEAIKYAIGKKLGKFDFGRSTPGEGTYRFKKQWGAQPVQLYWQYLLEKGRKLPELNPDNPKYRLAIKVWQKLPVSLTKMIGPHIVRNIP